MLKRFLAAALAVSMVAGMTACGSSSGPAAPAAAKDTAAEAQSQAEAAPEETSGTYKIGLMIWLKSMGQTNSSWMFFRRTRRMSRRLQSPKR